MPAKGSSVFEISLKQIALPQDQQQLMTQQQPIFEQQPISAQLHALTTSDCQGLE